MNRSHRHSCITIAALLIVATSGCGDARRPSRDKEHVLDAIGQAGRDSQRAEAPEPVIDLATPPGWSKSEPRALATDDRGFTVAYEHESGLAVTLYQFTRGRTSIPNEVNAAPVKEELRRAKNGIEQAVEVGLWQAAKENATETVMLGDSQQKALWSQYNLTIDGATVVSDIYVWAYSNTFFKLRCTSRAEDVASNQTVLKPLLTSLGTAAKPTDQ